MPPWFAVFISALTAPPYRIPQGVTMPRHLRPTAAGTVETSPCGSLSMRFTTLYLVAARIDEQDTGILVVALQLHENVVVRRAEGD